MTDLPKHVDIHEEGPREGFQIEPGPIPTFTASAPAFISAIAPSYVAMLPAISSISGNLRFTSRTASSTLDECPCAESIASASTRAFTSSAARSR